MRELIAFAFFLSYGEQSHARLLVPKNGTAIDFAHDSKLFQVLRFAIHVGAHINHDGGLAGDRGRKHGSQGRAVNAGQRAQHHFGSGHGSAGVAGGDKALRCAFAHQPQAYAHGRITLGTHRMCGFFVHADNFAGLDDFYGQISGDRMIGQLGFNSFRTAHEQHAGVAIACRLDCAFHLGTRRAVRAHGIDGNRGAGAGGTIGSKSGACQRLELVSHHAR